MINSNRLWNRLHELGEVGSENEGGVTRFSFTTEEREAKRLVEMYMKEAGLIVVEDSVGNLIGRKEGIDPNAPTIIIGSHIDTVKQGGKFDGALGVLAGIEVLQTMNEQNKMTFNPIEVIAFTDEEGSRFQFGMIGSRALTGRLKKEDLWITDHDGITIKQAMEDAGLHPELFETVKREPQSIKCYLELHIEQGKVLESNNLSVGVVSGIAGPLWTKWSFIGESGHAGATPMNMRHDPLIAFAELVQKMEQEAKAHPNTVATIGKVNVKPGGVNIIPNEVEFTIDLRDVNEKIRDEVEYSIRQVANEICKKYELEVKTSSLQRIKPVPCSEEIQKMIKLSCEKLHLKTMTLPSGAGHDAMQFKDICPVGMIFVRSKNGVSHNPKEFSSKEDCAAGTNVLYKTILKLSNG